MRTLILGIGNILWADEGFGVRAVEAFHARFETGNDVTILDGGTQGLYLVQFVETCDQLLVLDAIDYGLEPGTLRVMRDADVPHFMGAKKMSLHQTGFQEVLAAADLLGRYPTRLALIGCQPQDLEDWGGPLTAPAAAAIEPALAAAEQILTEWGVDLRRRDDASDERLLAHDLDHRHYERRPCGAEEETSP
ncbi:MULTISPECIES: HyaD/HybD family hydrogenase maturation endopeptidase [Methylosinus]|uniref:Hydrogenase expression/formation protein HupD n=1 Tax=Methylosinus trichosporium (strain ATCC 35070 / NCIMB 11131 / UNIQEM 75 / OB3b) TaxID=595536 RepID=A0A2D2CWE6_METT3|nr:MULTISPECIES: HyaD/HybD family hydrogenase maturation endopeptidase [Methylosinus]ATQ67057.1 HyaD/HybD family hydrogenase maturation endopeptidase [Methylosinus trichosporium OB3b]OBS50857.1 hydrogenase expression/formation protein [Methylosinus sp. 3S-1]